MGKAAEMRERITIPNTKYCIFVNLLCVTIIGITIILLIAAWSNLPNTIPTHYNAMGEADGWGGKNSILIMPAIAIFMYIGITVIERFPNLWNTGVMITEKNKEGVYLQLKNLIVTLKLSVIITFSYITVADIYFDGLNILFMPISMIIIFGPLVFFIVKMAKLPK